VAQVKLSADQDSGSEIDISAEQVKINGIIFTEGTVSPAVPGDIKSSNYSAGADGWKIEGNGDAEFNDVVVRGTVTNDTTYTIDANGIEFEVDASNDLNPVTARNVGFKYDVDNVAYVQGAYDTVAGRMTLVLGAESDVESYVEAVADAMLIANRFLVSQSLNRSITKFEVTDTTDSTSKDTGSIITEGGIGIEKNAYIGGDLYAPKVGVTTITDAQSPYTVLATDSYIGVDNSANAVTINLPAGTAGRKITIYDYAGTASLGTITINRASTNTINGSTSTTLTTNYQSVTLLFTGGNWTII
jgi:hypothetical protein